MTLLTHMSRIVLAGAGFVLLSAESCDTSPVDDWGFEDWSAGGLVHWQVDEGNVRETTTWHGSDSAVELLGAKAAISQRRSGGGGCWKLDLIADIEDSALVTFEVDVYADGVVDYEAAVPATNWQPVSFDVQIAAAPLYDVDGYAIRIHKRSAGRAVIAQIRATAVDCVLSPERAPRVLGAACDAADVCAEGSCAFVGRYPGNQCIDNVDELGQTGCAEQMVCTLCSQDSDCEDGKICALNEPATWALDLYGKCVTPGEDTWAMLCRSHEECASSLCSEGRCAECDDDADCGGGTCEATGPANVKLCAAVLPPAAACYADSACESGECLGSTVSICESDGRTCGDALDCPFYQCDRPFFGDGNCVHNGATCDQDSDCGASDCIEASVDDGVCS